MLTECAVYGGPEYLEGTFASLFGSLMDADLYYASYGYGGVVSSSFINITLGLVSGLIATQSFVNTHVSAITAPTFLAVGADDTLEPFSHSLAFWDQMSTATKAKSTFGNFSVESGGALHCQVGAEMILDDAVWSWIRSLGIVPPKPSSSTTSTSSSSILVASWILSFVAVILIKLQ